MVTITTHFAMLAELNPLEPVTVVPLFTLGPWPLVISNHAFMVLVVTALLLLLIPLAAHSPRLVPPASVPS